MLLDIYHRPGFIKKQRSVHKSKQRFADWILFPLPGKTKAVRRN
jgi:hypothetical protein